MYAVARGERAGQNFESLSTYLGIKNDPATLVNPKVLLHEGSILERQQAVREADQPVVGRHSESAWC